MRYDEIEGHEIRVNRFDEWVGEQQAIKVMELGVGTSLLDIGCGKGELTSMYKKRFDRVVGVEPTKEYVAVADRSTGAEYFIGDGETFKLNEKFDTIAMNMLIEHVDDPISLLENAKKHLSENGVIIVQVPNSRSITRRLGVLMGVIPSLSYMSEREQVECGHKRTYTVESLIQEIKEAGLEVLKTGGVLYKPFPNDMLEKICLEQGNKWRKLFISALVKFGEDRSEECANLYAVCK